MFIFHNLSTRSHRVLFDRSGFISCASHNLFFNVFDSRYVRIDDSFCASKAYLRGFYSILRSTIAGVGSAYFVVLHVKGIGFKVFHSVLKRALYFFLGYNHVTKYRLSAIVQFRPLKGHVLLFSPLSAVFGNVVYHIKHLRYPDPYRGKGIRNRFQLMKFKPGKQR